MTSFATSLSSLSSCAPRLVVVVLVFLLDQGTKSYISMLALALSDSLILMLTPDLFLILVFGGGIPLPDPLRLLLMLVALAWLSRQVLAHRGLIGLGFALALGGVLGNFLDHVLYSRGIDWLGFKLSFSPPILLVTNIADLALLMAFILISSSPFRRAMLLARVGPAPPRAS